MASNLLPTITSVVWLAGSPIPLDTVQRYVPLEFLVVLLMTKNPSIDGSSPLSVPFSHTLVQVIFGIGSPFALQLKVTIEPTQTYWSPVTLTMSGGSVEQSGG